MAAHQVGDIRNIAIVGHAGCGKTSLCEAILQKTGVTKRLGRVDDGSSTLDFDDESKERKQSIDSRVLYVEHDGTLVNLIDTPGVPDYCGTAIAALGGVETAIVVVSAAAGVEVNTRRMFNAAGEYGLARMIVINKIDAENANLEQTLTSIKESFGAACLPVNLPSGGGKSVIDVYKSDSGDADLLDVANCHTALLDAIVETDDEIMEAYMETGEVPKDKIGPLIRSAVASGHVVPVFFTNAAGDVGIEELLSEMVVFAPSPLRGKQREITVGQGDEATSTPIEPKPDAPLVAQVFKVTADPRSNIKYSVARIFSGTIKSDTPVVLDDDRKGQRPGHILKLRADQHEERDTASAGDIIALAKLDLNIGSMIWGQATEGSIARPKTPMPMFALALEPKERGDVEKLSAALTKYSHEDPCFQTHRDNQTGELVMQGMGDQHLAVIRSRMKRQYKIEVDTKTPKIPYRETITASVKYVEYTHKKQSGGSGQFARVFIDMEPTERGEGYEFVDKIFGGSIDQPLRPSVDKGIRAQLKAGVIAGCPVVDVRVVLVDGKTHPVDSKDIAFQIAGKQVFRKAFTQCKPILLEPIVNVEVMAPTEFVGDITRDLAGKRGHILGQDILPGGQTCVRATIPLAEVSTYNSQLKSVTGGQGSYSMELSHYDQVPPNVQQQIIAAYKPKGEDD